MNVANVKNAVVRAADDDEGHSLTLGFSDALR